MFSITMEWYHEFRSRRDLNRYAISYYVITTFANLRFGKSVISLEHLNISMHLLPHSTKLSMLLPPLPSHVAKNVIPLNIYFKMHWFHFKFSFHLLALTPRVLHKSNKYCFTFEQISLISNFISLYFSA